MFFQNVKIAIKSVLSNKIRSILTMLGVIIGVAAVIALVSIGEGTAQQVKQTMSSMGSNLIIVSVGQKGVISSLEYEKIKSLEGKYGIEKVAPVISGNATVKRLNKTFDASIEGVDEAYQKVRNYDVKDGRFIQKGDLRFRQHVVLLGSEVAEELFGLVNPVGETVKIWGIEFKVVGLLEEKGGGLLGNEDSKVLMPITVAERLTRNRGARQFFVQARDSQSVSTAMEYLKVWLNRHFKREDAYKIFNQEDMIEKVNETANTLSLMLGGIAGISLLVGGIGIMNIMLVSIMERTREIGIRKAIGATRSNILIQFLIESVTLSVLGGIIGIVLGICGSELIDTLSDLPTYVSPRITLIAFGFSVAVGVFFGFYPALKASKLNPIEALMYE